MTHGGTAAGSTTGGDRGLTRAAAWWAGSGALLLFFLGPLLYGLTAFLVAPVVFAHALFGTVLLGVAAVRAWRSRGTRLTAAERRESRVALLTLLGFVAFVAIAGVQFSHVGDELVFHASFVCSRSHYEAVVAAAERGELPAPDPARGGYGTHGGTVYVLDPGPPVRLAFPRPGGIIDNWEGVVYDPTDAVRAARGWTFARGRQEFTAPPGVRELFGGDIVACERVTEHFYRCWFT
jgi:hypothetical protein